MSGFATLSPMKKVAFLCFVAASLSAGQAQLVATKVEEVACKQGQVMVAGIILDNIEDYDVNDFDKALKKELESGGFSVKALEPYNASTLPLPYISISGSVNAWKAISGDLSRSRVGKVSLAITDLRADKKLYLLNQPQTAFVFNAPTVEKVATDVAQFMKTNFCSAPIK